MTGRRAFLRAALAAPVAALGGCKVPLSLEQGLMAFTALRRQDVPARLLYFPDEGHWVLKPQNAMVWWDTMLGWIDHYVGTRQPAE